MKKSLAIAITFFVLISLALWTNFGLAYLKPFRRLAADGERIEAKITAAECGNDQLYRYAFTTSDSQTFTGYGNKFAPTKTGDCKCDQLQPGTVVIVWYLPAEPTINKPGEPEHNLDKALSSVWIATTAFPGLVIGMLWLSSVHSVRRFLRGLLNSVIF